MDPTIPVAGFVSASVAALAGLRIHLKKASTLYVKVLVIATVALSVMSAFVWTYVLTR